MALAIGPAECGRAVGEKLHRKIAEGPEPQRVEETSTSGSDKYSGDHHVEHSSHARFVGGLFVRENDSVHQTKYVDHLDVPSHLTGVLRPSQEDFAGLTHFDARHLDLGTFGVLGVHDGGTHAAPV